MSNGPNGLKILEKERKNLLIAEVAGLLHDIGKFCDVHISTHVDNTPPFFRQWPKSLSGAYKIAVVDPASVIKIKPGGPFDGALRKLFGMGSPRLADLLSEEAQKALTETGICLEGVFYSLAELIMLARPGLAHCSNLTNSLKKDAWPMTALGICHGVAHVDKQEPIGGKQSFFDVRASTAFGFEHRQIRPDGSHDGLTYHLNKLPLKSADDYKMIRSALGRLLPLGLGDTRRPVNEVTLWDWSFAVASLYKAAVAGSLLVTGQKPDARGWLDRKKHLLDHDFQWRLLRIGINGLAFLARSPKLGDLLGRKQALEDTLDRLKELFEVTYPLGNEVYRDENGSAFLVPDLAEDKEGTRLRGLVKPVILDEFRNGSLQGEVVPEFSVSAPSDKAERLHELLREPPPVPRAFPEAVAECWEDEREDICTACGLRPQGHGAPNNFYRDKARERGVCYLCLKRRAQRAEAWACEKGPEWSRTIWIDEVSDRNGRLALLVGRFDLTNWLDGRHVKTLLVKIGKDQDDYVSKNPSFARLRRVWETTKRFWEAVNEEDIPLFIETSCRRVEVRPEDRDTVKDNLGDYHVYEADLAGVRTSLVWDPDRNRFLSADNLCRLAEVIAGPGAAGLCEPSKAVDLVCNRLGKLDKIPLYEPGGYGRVRQPHVVFRPRETRVIKQSYTPTIPILAEPATFMALIPADRALEVAHKIKKRFETEMGKVRNRLPFFLGLVFFDRRQPLFSAVDAARRMLASELPPESWAVRYTRRIGKTVCEIVFQNGISWQVPVVMGDFNTHDDWYPYYLVEKDAAGRAPSWRRLRFSLEEAGEERYWIHVENLAPYDRVKVYPARFAYLHLDTSARRFEAGSRPFRLLEELDEMVRLWQDLEITARAGRLTDTGLRGIEALFENKREMWGLNEPSKDAGSRRQRAERDHSSLVFAELVKATLRKERLEDVVQPEQVTNGVLTGTLDLYMRIMKRRLADFTQKEV